MNATELKLCQSPSDEELMAEQKVKKHAKYARWYYGMSPEKQAERKARRMERRAADPKEKQRANKTMRAWRAANPEKARANLRKQCLARYGLTPEAFDILLEAQAGLCGICRATLARGRVGNGVTVDHDHESGRVRGLLCNNCNRGVGMFSDSPGRLVAAARYLRKKETRRI